MQALAPCHIFFSDSQQQHIKKRQCLKKRILVSFFDKIFLQSQGVYKSEYFFNAIYTKCLFNTEVNRWFKVSLGHYSPRFKEL